MRVHPSTASILSVLVLALLAGCGARDLKTDQDVPANAPDVRSVESLEKIGWTCSTLNEREYVGSAGILCGQLQKDNVSWLQVEAYRGKTIGFSLTASSLDDRSWETLNQFDSEVNAPTVKLLDGGAANLSARMEDPTFWISEASDTDTKAFRYQLRAGPPRLATGTSRDTVREMSLSATAQPVEDKPLVRVGSGGPEVDMSAISAGLEQLGFACRDAPSAYSVTLSCTGDAAQSVQLFANRKTGRLSGVFISVESQRYPRLISDLAGLGDEGLKAYFAALPRSGESAIVDAENLLTLVRFPEGIVRVSASDTRTLLPD